MNKEILLMHKRAIHNDTLSVIGKQTAKVKRTIKSELKLMAIDNQQEI